MCRLEDWLPIPVKDAINSGLHAASERTMLDILGIPGPKTTYCSNSSVSPNIARRLVRADVGPFTVTGLKPAVESLQDIFDEVRLFRPDLFRAVRAAEMMCVRHVRNNPTVYSSHAWGIAIDLSFGDDGPVPTGERYCQRGIHGLYPFFHRNGWFWGAEFTHPNSMHFELAEETIRSFLGIDGNERLWFADDTERNAMTEGFALEFVSD